MTDFMKLTPNFTLMEFNCKSGAPVPDKYMDNIRMLARSLQVLRDAIGEPLHITSAYRTEKHNAEVGGVPDSQHLYGRAADIVCKSKTPRQLAAVIERLIKAGAMQQGGLGVYKSFVHYDVRGERARWKG